MIHGIAKTRNATPKRSENTLSRFTSAIALVAAATIALSGCAAATPEADGGSAGGAFPVTLEHVFGSTTIESEPERVVTWGWGTADAVLALGVVPVAMSYQAYGGDENGVHPWASERLQELGAEQPVVLPDSSEEPPYEDIVDAAPDIILAPFSGITEEQYELLSAIAPTVAYTGEPWTTPWRDVVETVGTALGRSAEAEEVLGEIDRLLADAAAAHPEFEGKTIAAVWDVAGTFYVYKPEDARVEFMLDLGLESAPSVEALSNGDSSFFYTLSYEELDQLESDIVVAYADTQEEMDAFLASGHGQSIPAVKAGAVAQLVGTEFIASVSPPSALSLTWGLDQLVEAMAEAAAAVQ